VDNPKIAKRYAQALFELACEQNVVDKIALDMQGIKACLEQSPDLRIFLRNPIFKKEERAVVIRSLFEKRANPLVLTFFLFLIEKARLNMLGEIVAAFDALYLNYKNIANVVVKTASAIEPKQMDALVKKLKERLAKDIQPRVIMDEGLIGGFKIHMDDVVYDCSFKTQLEKFQKSVITAI